MEQPSDEDARMRSLLKELNHESQSLDEQLEQLKVIERSVMNELVQVNTECYKALNRINDFSNTLSKLEFSLEQQNKEYKILEDQSLTLHSEIDVLSQASNDLKKRYKAEVDNYVLHVEKLCLGDREAANLYTDAGLCKSMQDMEGKMLEADENLKKAGEELEEINQEINNVTARAHPDHEMAITTEQRKLVLEMFNDENAAAHWTLGNLQKEKKEQELSTL